MKSSLKLFNLVLIAGALCATGLRAQTIGGVSPQAKPKKFTFGVGYANMQQTFKFTSAIYQDYGTGARYSDPAMIDQEFDFDQNRVYLETGYAFGQNIELTARLGLNYQDMKDLPENYGNTAFSGLTFRWRFYQGGVVGYGLVVNGNYSSKGKKTFASTSTVVTGVAPNTTTVTAVTNARTSAEGVRDGMIALPVEFKIGSRAAFYMAPAYVRTAGRFRSIMDSTVTTTVVSGSTTTTTTAAAAPLEFHGHFTRLNSVGGYTGLRFGDSDWQFNVEAAYINGITASFGFRRAF